MKKIIMLTALAATISCGAMAQKMKADKVPQAVRTAFAKAYPNVKDADWEKEDGDYEVGFEQGKEEYSVVFDAQGNLLETEKEIKTTELPAAVQAPLKGKKIKEVAVITRAGKTYYEAEVGGRDLLFDADGKPAKLN
ncbi:PepSY-like domain-containing protein [Persicitalea jodogahamensis]|uniref:Putative beta-lactamase-inhibitor-like PepSY-like domain-containing protein n=1 Tax=Persicitalea jodogahamensis TaxID=402147 RepID=A0A8J3D2T1_9BACT|nr:PepSY-like domain-containing protein [Persicitalea jodogahamensis]GHB60644.1 hypothetical protein GCM10007390_12960 [Persicitalea jodogahamensis]